MLNQRSTKIRKLSAPPCENLQQIIFVEARLRVSRFGKGWLMQGTPPPPWSIEIIDLRRILELIYWLQSLRGKILSRRELAAEIGFSRTLRFSFCPSYDRPLGVWKAMSDVT